MNEVQRGHSHTGWFRDCGYFHDVAAELSSCDRDSVVCEARNVYCLVLYRKRVLTPVYIIESLWGKGNILDLEPG